jgi:ribonuclease HI
LISGQSRTSPHEALRVETGIPSISSQINANCLRSRAKAFRLPSDHPRKIALMESAPVHLKNRNNFRSRAEKLALACKLDEIPRKDLTFFQIRPWDRGIRPNLVFPYLEGIEGKHDAVALIRTAALRRARDINADYNIYTDGSASAGTTDGGAGVVVTRGDPGSPIILQRIMERGAAITSSFDEEYRAMLRALDWIEEHLDCTHSVAIFSDSQSLCMALVGDIPSLDSTRFRLNNIPAHTTIQWIPGHCEILGNEWADETAKNATSSEGPKKPVTYGSVCAYIKNCTKDPPPKHARTRAVYESLSQTREKQIVNRQDQTLLAQLRSGHSTALQAYRHRIGIAESPMCPQCQQEPQDLEHWVSRCPANEARRRNLFGEDSGRLDCLTRYPREMVALARSTLLGETIRNPSSTDEPAFARNSTKM